MHVEVNGAKLYVDVENSGLVPDGNRMREKPTLLLLHGGPGFDHTGFKPAFSALSDIVQIVYYDHRGNGRSTGTNPATWNLAQWGDDVKAPLGNSSHPSGSTLNHAGRKYPAGHPYRGGMDP